MTQQNLYYIMVIQFISVLLSLHSTSTVNRDLQSNTPQWRKLPWTQKGTLKQSVDLPALWSADSGATT